MGLTVLAAFDNDDIVLVAGLLDRVLHDKYYFIIDQRCTFGTPTYQIAKHIYMNHSCLPRGHLFFTSSIIRALFSKTMGMRFNPKRTTPRARVNMLLLKICKTKPYFSWLIRKMTADTTKNKGEGRDCLMRVGKSIWKRSYRYQQSKILEPMLMIFPKNSPAAP